MAITISYVGARGDHLPLGGTDDTVGQHQPARSEVPGARRGGAEPDGAEPVLRQSRAAGPLVDAGDADARAAAAAVPAVPATSRRGRCSEGVNRYNAAVIEWSKRPTQRLRRPRQLHLQRAEGQPDRRDQLLHRTRQRRAAEQLQLHRRRCRPARATSTSRRVLQPARGLRLRHPRRAAPRSSSRRSGSCRSARAGKSGPRASVGEIARRRLDGLGGHQPAERLPDRPRAERQHAASPARTGRT